MKSRYLAAAIAVLGLGIGGPGIGSLGGLGVGIGIAAEQSPVEFFAHADPAKGARTFNKCKACHTIEEGGPARVGPNLWGVIGRPVASKEGYSYSTAMLAQGGTWTVDRLFVYLANPRQVVPGTAMTFVGLPKPQERADLIAYLNQNSGSPVDLVAAAQEGAAAPQ
ncbi:MAG: cytochrome c family protein [Bauldia sp.]|nr:cytochrome c family protein [Bauldia sp.]